MKCTMMLALFAAILVAVCAIPFDHKVRRPPPRGGVSFPGYGSFNPRGRRSLHDGSVEVGQPIVRDPEVQVDLDERPREGGAGDRQPPQVALEKWRKDHGHQ